MKCIPNRQAKAGAKTSKSSPHSVKSTSPKKAAKPVPAPNSKAARKVAVTSLAPAEGETSHQPTDHIPADFAEMLREQGFGSKPAEQVIAARRTNEEFEADDRRWSEFQGEVSGLAYHIAASHTGYGINSDVTKGGTFQVQMRLHEDLPLWENHHSEIVCAEDRKVQLALESAGDSGRFPADFLLHGACSMLEEYAALLAVTREGLRGNIAPITYPILLGLFAIRTGGWWDDPHCDSVPEWECVQPFYGSLVEYLWKVGPQTGASGQFGEVVELARCELEALFAPNGLWDPVLLELVLMDTCRLAVMEALREAKAGVDLRERIFAAMDKLLGASPYAQEVFPF